MERLVILLGFLLGVFLVACTTSIRKEEHNPLLKQILAPRVGYKTLTNQVINCDDKKVCVVSVREYDLNDQEVRNTLKELGFRCDIGGKIYFICANGPGFCRREYDIIHKFLGIVTKREPVFAEPIDINDRYQFLLDAKTRCQSSRVESN